MSHGNPYGRDSFPPHEIERRMMLALTYGARPSIAVAQPPRLQEELYRCMDEVQKRKPWITHSQPEPWAALLMSDNTRTFYGREPGKVEERYLANVLGTFRACVEEHLPVTVINDWNLNREDLAKYKTLILPNAACLDERQARAIEVFVKNGGGVVASLDASLFDEFGDPRRNFALAEVLGVDYRGLPPVAPVKDKDDLDLNFAKGIGPDYWEKRKNVFDFRQDTGSFLNVGKMKTYVGPEPVTFKGPAVRVAPRGAKAVATIRGRSADAPGMPAVLTHVHGKGRVVYFAAGLDAAYYLYPYPYHRLALKHAIQWSAGVPAPIDIAAPMCVHATVMRQTKNGANRLVVHLFNDANTTGGHALPVDDVPLREETLPIADIRVTFGPEYRIRRITLQPEGKELETKATAAGTTVSVPRLEIHTLVVAEVE
jgi:hypothetical protein